MHGIEYLGREDIVRIWRLLAALLLVLVAAACGGDTGGEAETEAPAEEGSETEAPAEEGSETEAPAAEGTGAADAGEPVEITMWVAREQYLPTEGFLASLAETYPNITLTAELQPDDALFFQLQRMADAGEPLPDLVQLDSYYAAPMYDLDLAIDLTDQVARWEEEEPETFGLVADTVFYEHEGAIVGLGTTGTMDILYQRPDLLAEAGFDQPLDSFDAILEATRALKEADPESYPFSMIGTRGEGANWFYSHLVAAGVEFEGVTPDMTSEAGQSVISFYQTLSREGLVDPEVLAWGEDEARGAWIGGRAALMIDGIRSSNDIGNAIEEGLGISNPEGWRMGLLPAEGSGSNVVATRTFHIPPTSEHQDEAMLVLRLAMTTENAIDAAQSGALYLQTEVLSSDQFAEAYPFVEPEILDAFQNGSAFPAASNFFGVVEVLERMIQDMIQSPDEDPAAFAERWQAELDAVEAG